MKSQNEKILTHLKSGKSLTPQAALKKFGTFRLAARIYDLRQAGHAILDDWHEVSRDTKVKRYYISHEA